MQTTILPDLVQGTTLAGFEARIVRAGEATLTRVKVQFRASQMEGVVLSWDSDEDQASIAPAIEGEGVIADFEGKSPADTAAIRPGTYRAEIMAYYSDGEKYPVELLTLTIIGAYTK